MSDDNTCPEDSYLEDVKEIEDDVINENPIGDRQYYRGDKKLPRENAQFAFTPAMVKEMKKCKEDITHFAEKHFYIVNIDRGKEKIELYPAQKRVLKSLAKNRFVTVLASRQVGKCLKCGVMLTIRNKQTLETEEVTIENFYKRVG